MQASAEISHKVRLAIKTKLTELGAYVDDELPDYVLVMVANRRGRSDMKKELELFLGEATERFCTWLFGVLDKLKDAKKGRDKTESDDEKPKAVRDDKADLDSYSESDSNDEKTTSTKKEQKIKEKVKKEPDIELKTSRTKKSVTRSKSRTKSKSPVRRKSPTLRMDRQQSPKRLTAEKKRTKTRSRSPVDARKRRNRSISRDRRRSRSFSRDRSSNKEKRRDKKIKKDKKEKRRNRTSSPSPSRTRGRKDSEKLNENEDDKRSRLSKKIKAQGGLRSTLAIQKEPELDEAEKKELETRTKRGEKEKPIKAVKPTSNLIIRAINDSAGTKNLSITRSITVKGAATPANVDVKKEKPGTKRKSKGGNDEPENEVKQKKVKSGNDQRVFITKTAETTTISPGEDKKTKKKKIDKKQRPVSPKFFVTLDGEKKEDVENKVPVKALSPAKSPADHLIIHPNITSDDSDDDSEKTKNLFRNINNTAQEEAEKIKKLQEQHPLPLIELGQKQSTLPVDIGSIDTDDPDARTIFVSGLDWRVTEKELKEHFEVCGAIVRVTVLKDYHTQFSKGCAYIQFATVEQRKTAVNFDNTEVYGRTIRVVEKMSQPHKTQPTTYTPAAYAPQTLTYNARPRDPKYSFRNNSFGQKSQYTWVRKGIMPPR